MKRPFSKLPDRTALAQELRRLARPNYLKARDLPLCSFMTVVWWGDGEWVCRPHGWPVERRDASLSVCFDLPCPLIASSTYLAMDIRDQLAEKRKAFFKERERDEQAQTRQAASSQA